MKRAKRLLTLALSLVLTLSFMLPALAAGIGDFKDSAASKTYFDDKGALGETYQKATQLMIDLGVVVGSDLDPAKSSLDLSSELSRIQFMVLLYKVLNGGAGIDDPANKAGAQYTIMQSQFSDMNNHWGKAYANWAFMTGVSAGDGTGKFNPEAKLSLMDALLFSMKAIGLRPDTMYEPNYAYDVRSIYTIASQLILMDNVVDTLGGNVDRGAAFVLFYNLLWQGKIGYNLTTGARNIDWDDCLIFSSFGFTSGTFLIVSDGNWFNLSSVSNVVGAVPAIPTARSGKAVLQYRRNIGGVNYRGEPATFGSYNYTLSAELTKALGIDMYDVGRSIKIAFRDTWDSDNITQAYIFDEKDKYADKLYETYNGIAPAADGWRGNSLSNMAFKDHGLTNTQAYLNYGTPAAANLPWAFGSFAADCRVRVIYDDNDVLFTFVERYTLALFDKIDSNGNVATKNTSAASGLKPAAVKDYTSDIKENAVLLTFGIGSRAGLYLLENTVEGVLESVNVGSNSGRLGGTSYSSMDTWAKTGLYTLQTGLGAPTNVGDTMTYWLWQGKVAYFKAAVPADRPTDFALVVNTEVRLTSATTLGTAATWAYYVDVVLQDGTRKVFELKDIINVDKSGASAKGNAAFNGTGQYGTNSAAEGVGTLKYTGKGAGTAFSNTLIDRNIFAYAVDGDKITLYDIGGLAINKSPISPSGAAMGSNDTRFPANFLENGVGAKYVIPNTVTFIQTGANSYVVYRGNTIPGTAMGFTTTDIRTDYLLSNMSGGEQGATGAAARAVVLKTASGNGVGNGFAGNQTTSGIKYAFVQSDAVNTINPNGGVHGAVTVLDWNGAKTTLFTANGQFSNAGFSSLGAGDIMAYKESGGTIIPAGVAEVANASGQATYRVDRTNLRTKRYDFVLDGFYASTKAFTVKKEDQGGRPGWPNGPQRTAATFDFDTTGGDTAKFFAVNKYNADEGKALTLAEVTDLDIKSSATQKAIGIIKGDVYATGGKVLSLWIGGNAYDNDPDTRGGVTSGANLPSDETLLAAAEADPQIPDDNGNADLGNVNVDVIVDGTDILITLGVTPGKTIDFGNLDYNGDIEDIFGGNGGEVFDGSSNPKDDFIVFGIDLEAMLLAAGVPQDATVRVVQTNQLFDDLGLTDPSISGDTKDKTYAGGWVISDLIDSNGLFNMIIGVDGATLEIYYPFGAANPLFTIVIDGDGLDPFVPVVLSGFNTPATLAKLTSPNATKALQAADVDSVGLSNAAKFTYVGSTNWQSSLRVALTDLGITKKGTYKITIKAYIKTVDAGANDDAVQFAQTGTGPGTVTFSAGWQGGAINTDALKEYTTNFTVLGTTNLAGTIDFQGGTAWNEYYIQSITIERA